MTIGDGAGPCLGSRGDGGGRRRGDGEGGGGHLRTAREQLADRRRAWAGRPAADAAALKNRGEIRSGVDMTPVACGCGEIKPKRRGRGGAAGSGAGGWRWPRCLHRKNCQTGSFFFFFFFFERHELGVEGRILEVLVAVSGTVGDLSHRILTQMRPH